MEWRRGGAWCSRCRRPKKGKTPCAWCCNRLDSELFALSNRENFSQIHRSPLAVIFPEKCTDNLILPYTTCTSMKNAMRSAVFCAHTLAFFILFCPLLLVLLHFSSRPVEENWHAHSWRWAWPQTKILGCKCSGASVALSHMICLSPVYHCVAREKPIWFSSIQGPMFQQIKENDVRIACENCYSMH